MRQALFLNHTRESQRTAQREIAGYEKGDIWFASKNEQGVWQRPEPVEGELNTEMDEGIMSFSPTAA